MARIPTGANASLNTSRPIRFLSRGGTVDAAVLPARLQRIDDCRLLREMDVVVRAWRWGVTFATAKKLLSLAAGTAAICSAPHHGGPERSAPNILHNEKVFTVF
jgi:hypothetical protein